MARTPDTTPASGDYWMRNYGYTCRLWYTTSKAALSLVTVSSSGSVTYVTVATITNYVSDDVQYAMTFTVEGTALTCTVTETDSGDAVSSISGTSSVFTSDYNSMGVYSASSITPEVYLSNFDIE